MKYFISTIILMTGSIASAQGTILEPQVGNPSGPNLGSLVGVVVSFINEIVLLITAAALLVFFWGLAKFIYSAGDAGEHARGRNLMLWGTIIFFVMGSLWGIIRFMANSIFVI